MCSSTVSCTKSASSCRLAFGMICPTSCLIPASTCFWLARDMVAFLRCLFYDTADRFVLYFDLRKPDEEKKIRQVEGSSIRRCGARSCSLPFQVGRMLTRLAEAVYIGTRSSAWVVGAPRGGGADWRQGQYHHLQIMRAAQPYTEPNKIDKDYLT